MTVRFVDGEQLEGDAEQVTLDRGGFTLVGTQGNSRSVWVSSTAVKYILIHPAAAETYGEVDPRDGSELPKVVLRFLDGQVLRTYQDEVFNEQPGGFALRLWDSRRKQLVRALVAGAALKGIFMVDEWDSRVGGARRSRGQLAAEPAWTPAVKARYRRSPRALGPLVRHGETAPDEAIPEVIEEVPGEIDEVLGEMDELPEGIEELPEGIEGPLLVEEPPLTGVIATGGTSEERRATFASSLSRRRDQQSESTPHDERRRLLRLRVSEVLGRFPADHDDDEDEA